jgi:hypothetical protein
MCRIRLKTRRTVTKGWLIDQNWSKPAETIITKPRTKTQNQDRNIIDFRRTSTTGNKTRQYSS